MSDTYVPSKNDLWDVALHGARAAADDAGRELDEVEFRALFDRAFAAHDAEVAARALDRMALALETPRFISSFNQEPPMQRMTNEEIVAALRARAAEYRKAVQS